VKFAVTSLPANVTVQVVLDPVQFPVQPPNPKLVAGVAVSVTCETPLKVAEQVPGQLIPGGLLVTVPEPGPATLTVSCETP